MRQMNLASIPARSKRFFSESVVFSLREECRMRVFENKLLRKYWGPRGMR
jgi:hypothetical protein